MKRRILTALPLVIAVAWLVWLGPPWLFLLVLLATVERALYEFFTLSRQSGVRTFPSIGYIAGILLCFTQWVEIQKPVGAVLTVIAAVMVASLLLALFWTADLKQYLTASSSTLLGIVYVGFTLSLLVPIRFSNPAVGRVFLLFLLLVIWVGDACAYLVGRSLGRTPLAPRISPKKTVEGAVGGFVGSLVVGWVFARLFWQTADLKAFMLLAGLVAVAGQFGDLVESALKRGAGLKDSGNILPGHGGLLDRVDSLLFGAPALWLVLSLKDFWKR